MRPASAHKWIALVALATGGGWAAAAEVGSTLNALFDHGAKSTSSAVAAARQEYERLGGSRDPRIDYAYGVVLVHQRHYRDALPLVNAYLATDKPPLAAYCVKMWADISLQEYDDALQQAVAVSRRFPSKVAPSQVDEHRQAAQFLGTVFGYLEFVRPEAIDEQVRSNRRNEVVERLGPAYAPAFDEARQAVERTLKELRAEHKSELEELRAKLAAQQKQGKSAAQEKEHLQTDTEQRDEAEKEYERVQTQLAPLESKMVQLQSQISQAQMRLQRGRNPYQMQSLRSNLTTLSNQAVQLAKQIEPLQKQLAELGSKEARQAGAVAKDKSKMRQAEKAASDTEKRLHNLDAQLKSTAPVGKMLLLSSYLPFPYEQERQRVTGWFSK